MSASQNALGTPLTDAEREQVRQLAEGISATLADTQRASVSKVAWELRDMLMIGCECEPIAARMSFLLAQIIGQIGGTSVSAISQTLDTTLTSYALAAGSLAGVYELPEREVPQPGPRAPAPQFDPDWASKREPVAPTDIGGYL